MSHFCQKCPFNRRNALQMIQRPLLKDMYLMQNEVPHIYYQENKTGSDSSSLGQFIGGNVT